MYNEELISRDELKKYDSDVQEAIIWLEQALVGLHRSQIVPPEVMMYTFTL